MNIARPALLFSICLLTLRLAPGAGAESTNRPPLKTDIMGVFAHPDDETGMAATLARYAHGKGAVIANIYCTRGEGGGNMVGTQSGASLGILREAELRSCLKELGIQYCYFLDQLDWAYTESLAATLNKWGKEATLERLVRHVRALRPEIIVTMNPAPSPGQHGHHQAAATLATEAYEAAADPSRFPEQLSKEGLAPWQVRRLYYSGAGKGHVTSISVTESLPDGRTPAQIAGVALSNHRSQAFGNFANSPWLRRPQSFTLIKSRVPSPETSDDLLAGLPSDPLPNTAKQAQAQAAEAAPLTVEFIPRPAIVRYRSWLKDQNISHLAEDFAADLPVVAGTSNPIQLILRNNTDAPARPSLQVQAGTNWNISPPTQPIEVAPKGTLTLTYFVTPVSEAKEDVEITAVAALKDQTVNAVARLHPVPQTKAAKLTQPLALDADAKWNSIPSLPIESTQLAQGRVTSENDSKAAFRLAHDGQAFFIEVDVTDDQIVSNIAPNDIKGHWRSDSVELCIDPQGGAEDTMGCFKVGIFPFDTTGKVRASRDADSNQGPIEETAPSVKLHSSRTGHGYRIRAIIPFKEIGLNGDNPFGFNIIIYDGDKKDAALGENINESRLAWAPRAGVQGRPEDWGRVTLE